MDSMSGCDIRLVFTFPPKDSTLQYKKCVHLWNNFPCISTLVYTKNMKMFKHLQKQERYTLRKNKVTGKKLTDLNIEFYEDLFQQNVSCFKGLYVVIISLVWCRIVNGILDTLIFLIFWTKFW